MLSCVRHRVLISWSSVCVLTCEGLMAQIVTGDAMDPLAWSAVGGAILGWIAERGTSELADYMLGRRDVGAAVTALTDEMRQREPAIGKFEEALRYLRTGEPDRARERLISSVGQCATAAVAHALIFCLDAVDGNERSAQEALRQAMSLNPFLLPGLIVGSGRSLDVPSLLAQRTDSGAHGHPRSYRAGTDEPIAFVTQRGLDDVLPVLGAVQLTPHPIGRWHLPLAGGWVREQPPQVLPLHGMFPGSLDRLIRVGLACNPFTGECTLLMLFQARVENRRRDLLAVDGLTGRLLWWAKTADLLLAGPEAVFHRTLSRPQGVQALATRTGAVRGSVMAEPVFRRLVEGGPPERSWPSGWTASTGGAVLPTNRSSPEATWIVTDPFGIDPIVVVIRNWLILQSEGFLAPKSEWFRTVALRID